jgi:hypothetical protein
MSPEAAWIIELSMPACVNLCISEETLLPSSVTCSRTVGSAAYCGQRITAHRPWIDNRGPASWLTTGRVTLVSLPHVH